MSKVPTRVEALRKARKLGCEVTEVKRTGEVDIVSPLGDRVRHNNRRKDASRVLLTLIKKLEGKEHRFG